MEVPYFRHERVNEVATRMAALRQKRCIAQIETKIADLSLHSSGENAAVLETDMPHCVTAGHARSACLHCSAPQER
jgi:hypothetical protein